MASEKTASPSVAQFQLHSEVSIIKSYYFTANVAERLREKERERERERESA